MSKSNPFIGALAAVLLLAVAVPTSAQAKKYNLGREATPAEIAGWNIDVRPDGAGLPEGHGSVDEGNVVYDTHCASCHGTFGESNDYIPLTTGIQTKVAYATTVFDYINRAMPFPRSKVLTPDEVYAVTAYVLNLNNIVEADFVADKDTLPKVKMPAHDKIKPYPGLMSVHGKSDVNNVACMKNCESGEVKVTARLPDGFTETLYGDIRDNFNGLATMNEAGPLASAAPAKAADATALLQQFGCTACHGLTNKIVGPGFNEITAKYQGDPAASAHLTKKIRDGGSGVWGAIPMPPQPDLSDQDLATIVHWVLTPPKKD